MSLVYPYNFQTVLNNIAAFAHDRNVKTDQETIIADKLDRLELEIVAIRIGVITLIALSTLSAVFAPLVVTANVLGFTVLSFTILGSAFHCANTFKRRILKQELGKITPSLATVLQATELSIKDRDFEESLLTLSKTEQTFKRVQLGIISARYQNSASTTRYANNSSVNNINTLEEACHTFYKKITKPKESETQS